MNTLSRTLLCGSAALALALAGSIIACDRAYDEDDEAQGVRYQNQNNPFAPTMPNEPPTPATEENQRAAPNAPHAMNTAPGAEAGINQPGTGYVNERGHWVTPQPGSSAQQAGGNTPNQSLDEARVELQEIRRDLENAHGALDRLGLQARQGLRDQLSSLNQQAESVAQSLERARTQPNVQRSDMLRAINESLRDLRRGVDDLTDETDG